MEPSTQVDNTLEVEGKLLEIEMVSHDLSTTTLISLGVSLMPSKRKHSNSHMVESLNSLLLSLKWAKWLSWSHGLGTISSLKHIGIGSVSSTPCASIGEGKIPCSPFLTLSPSSEEEFLNSSIVFSASMVASKDGLALLVVVVDSEASSSYLVSWDLHMLEEMPFLLLDYHGYDAFPRHVMFALAIVA
jgi:hypothetical protein